MPHLDDMPATEPGPPKKSLPVLHLDLEDIEGIGDVQIDDRLTLHLTVRVGQLSKPPDAEYTGVTLDVLKVRGGERQDREPDADV